VIVADIYHPEVWTGFFTLVGTAAATLTGLVFVSMSLHLSTITQDATHRYRAISTLAGLAGIFMICAFAIMGGQNHLAIGIEWLIVALISGAVYINGYVQALKGQGSSVGLGLERLAAGTTCHIVEIIGAIILILGHIIGIYIAAVAMIIYIPFIITGAWLLMVGVHQDITDQQRKSSSK
jgi:hypothetical protein